MKLFIIHPGIQHSPRLANAAVRSKLFNKVYLITSILLKPNTKTIGILRKRIKPIDVEVKIVNHYVYTLLFEISKTIHNRLFANPNNQSHNNPIYFWQKIFGWMCLPMLYLNRKNCMVICFETAGWPITKYCQKWHIPVVMDFASISHEKAKELGINETSLGKAIKTKERQHIDFAFFCSNFCRQSFEGLTSSQKDFVLYLGAEPFISLKSEVSQPRSVISKGDNELLKIIKISFIANLEYRKGLDILLEALYSFHYDVFLEVHLIGKIRPEWVNKHLPVKIINQRVKLIYRKAMSQKELFQYLESEQFNLNVQPSRFDSFAMVVPETMTLGIPNLVSPFVGAGEMLENGVNGFIMKQLNAYSIFEVLSEIINLGNLEPLRANVLQKARQLTWVNYSKMVKSTFNEILKTINKI